MNAASRSVTDFSATAATILMAAIFVVAMAWGVLDFPLYRPALAVALVAYAAALVRWRWIWLVVLPAILPVVDLAPWSGRFYFDEFDFFILATAGIGYGLHSSGPVISRFFTKPTIVVIIFAASVIASVALRLIPIPAIDVDSFTTYLSPWNALRVAKGFLSAWLLLPLLMIAWERDAEATKNRLVAGILLGLGFAVVAVLWERGVFAALISGRNIYGLLGSLLDFSGTYRITGLFSGMHVGGEAIDGYLSLALPLTLYPALFARRTWLRVLGLALFAGGTYAVMVTFSRGLYGGFAISLVGILVLLTWRNFRRLKSHGLALAIGLGLFSLFTAILAVLYSRGGFEALALGILLVVAAAVTGAVAPPRWRLPAFVAVAAIAIVICIRIYGDITGSKWAQTGAAMALVISVTATVLLAWLSLAAGRPLLRDVGRTGGAVILLLAALFWVGTLPPLTGSRAQVRFSTVGKDFTTRADHWNHAYAALDPSLQTQLFGSGVGSFPQLFFSYMLSTDFSLATYSVEREDGQGYLRLGSGDFNIVQRAVIKPHNTYHITARLRAEVGKPGIGIKICHKHLLYSERYTPECRQTGYSFKRKKSTDGWVEFEADVKSGNLGRWGVFYWPTTIMLHANNGVIDITDLRIADAAGRNVIRNGDFSAGLDNWFLVSDFEHLAWHAKNIYLHFLIEQGWFGLAAFLLFAGVALCRAARAAINGDHFFLILFPSLVSFMLVGIFGTLIDMPRVATLFYLLLLTCLTPQPSRTHDTR